MDTLNLWNEIKKLNGNILRTLDRHNPFEIIAVTESTVIIRLKSTGNERPISRKGLEEAYRHLMVTGRLTCEEIDQKYTPRNPVYTAAILAEMPGVQYKLNPIRLLISN